MLTAFERVEPRCRVCRDPAVRRLINARLDWLGTPIVLGQGKSHTITYVDIWRGLDCVNEGCDPKDRITYSSLWVHAKKHHDWAAVAAYQMANLLKELRKTLGISKVPTKLGQGSGIKYEG